MIPPPPEGGGIFKLKKRDDEAFVSFVVYLVLALFYQYKNNLTAEVMMASISICALIITVGFRFEEIINAKPTPQNSLLRRLVDKQGQLIKELEREYEDQIVDYKSHLRDEISQLKDQIL